MAYKVIITDQAQQDFSDILDYPHAKFSALQRLKYVEDLQERCLSLDFMPQRFRQVQIGQDRCHILTFKAHLVIYTIDEAARVVSILTIRAGAMSSKV